MTNGLQSLSDLFQNRLFRIPDYQRGFAWRDEQLVDLWEDLVNLHEDRFHYTGLLSLKPVSRDDARLWGEDKWLLELGYKGFHVVDGQQRLTSFSILLYEITKLVKNITENKDKTEEQVFLGFESLKDIKTKFVLRKRPPNNIVTTYLFGYETDNPSSDYLKYKVFEESFGGTVKDTYYTSNLKYAKQFFAENLVSLYETEGMDGIAKLYKKLTLQLTFNLHEIEDDYDVFVAFETMNNRGKKLTNLELLKNRLIYLTTLFDDCQLDSKDKDQLRKNINDSWKEVYYQLGRNQLFPLSDDDFLRAHWITYYQYSRKRGDDYIRFLLRQFSAKNVFEKTGILSEVETSEPLPGFDVLNDDDGIEEIPDSDLILVSKLAPREITDYINSLMALVEPWYYSFFPQSSPSLNEIEMEWVDKINRVGIGYFRPLLVAALATAKNSTPDERIALFQAIERFIFLSFRVGGINASYRSSDYYNKARELLQGKLALTAIIEDLDTSVEKDMESIVAGFITRTSRRFSSGEGFYGWRDLKYFLYEYEYVLATRYDLHKIDWNIFSKSEKDKVSIEHILPQTPTKLYWRSQFRQFEDAEISQLSASLGNLVPLAKSINSSLQNDNFAEKKRQSPTGIRGYVNGSHSEIEVAAESDWTAQNILRRGISLLGFMEKRWKIKFSSEQKIELLHIDFVNDGRAEQPEIPENQSRPGRSLMPNKVHPTDKLAITYEISKKVFIGSLGFTEGKLEIFDKTGINQGTAGDFITNFSAMMKGKRYTRTLTADATRYFVLHIREDYGEIAFQNAIVACRKHAIYYASLGYGRLRYVEKIVEEFSN